MHGEVEKAFLMSYLRSVEKEIEDRFESFSAHIDKSGMYPILRIGRKE